MKGFETEMAQNLTKRAKVWHRVMLVIMLALARMPYMEKSLFFTGTWRYGLRTT